MDDETIPLIKNALQIKRKGSNRWRLDYPSWSLSVCFYWVSQLLSASLEQERSEYTSSRGIGKP
jgi:hypothetical protein